MQRRRPQHSKSERFCITTKRRKFFRSKLRKLVEQEAGLMAKVQKVQMEMRRCAEKIALPTRPRTPR